MIAVLGEALWDVYPQVRGQRLRTRRKEIRFPGGAPANVARALARLGVPVTFYGAVGDDALGEALVDVLSGDGVDVSHVQRVPARTGLTFVDPRPDGSVAFVGYREADFLLTPAAVGKVEADLLHLGSTSFARAPIREAATHAMAQVPCVSLDLNVYPRLWREPILPVLEPLLCAVDILKASEDDLRALDLSADGLHDRRKGKLTIVTRGAAGALAFDGDTKIEVPARSTRVIDPTGAGDAFAAGVLSVLTALGPHACERSARTSEVLARALDRGAELAAQAVSRVGATSWLR